MLLALAWNSDISRRAKPPWRVLSLSLSEHKLIDHVQYAALVV